VAPVSDIEQQLCLIWQQLLSVERVGIKDNFFELGGHSLLATRLTSELAQTWGIEVAVKALFERQTIIQLAPYIEKQHALVQMVQTQQTQQHTTGDEETEGEEEWLI
jgi:acyl carrier protein